MYRNLSCTLSPKTSKSLATRVRHYLEKKNLFFLALIIHSSSRGLLTHHFHFWFTLPGPPMDETSRVLSARCHLKKRL